MSGCGCGCGGSSAVAVSVRSLKDDRGLKLFPCYCGDDGAVNAINTDRYGVADGHKMLSPAPPLRFRRLGVESRKLVMSLYRAIVERFYIMRAKGCEWRRPAKACFCFGGVLTACNCDPGKMDLAGRNRRRAFGGTFRDVFDKLTGSGYDAAASCVDCGGVAIYPFTPYVEGAQEIGCFMPGISGSTSEQVYPITWEGSSAISDRFKGFGGCDSAPWLLDIGQRPLLKRFAKDYCWGCWADAGTFSDFVDGIAVHGASSKAKELPLQRLRPYDATGLGLDCAASVRDLRCHYFKCGAGVGFNLPALASALRIVSAWNAQTVRFGDNKVGIPHKYARMHRRRQFGTSGNTITYSSEEREFVCCVRYLNEVRYFGKKTYQTGNGRLGAGTKYYNLGSRVPIEADVPMGVSRIEKECWEEWDARYCRSNSGGADAIADYCMLSPATLEDGKVITFGANYPAKWARDEIGFGAVSTFAKDDCGHRAWVVVTTKQGGRERYGYNLSEGLAGHIVCSAKKRLCADVANMGFHGDTFAGMAFPEGESAVRYELIDSEAPNDEELAALVESANRQATETTDFYCYIEVYNCSQGHSPHYYGIRCGVAHEIDVIDGWMALSSLSPVDVGFGYDRHINPNCGMETVTRHGWGLSRSIQFGGFYSTFRFNNRAAQQTI